jgi:hypothetical protein
MLRSINEFLSDVPSRGPREPADARSEFTSFEAADLDIKLLLALLRRRHRVTRDLCIPNFVLCGSPLTHRSKTRRCPKGSMLQIRAGVVLVNANARARLVLPPDFERTLRCSKRFVVCNFGIYAGTSLHSGHANALVFDTVERLIERYEPSGHDHDETLRTLFARVLPDWTYVGTQLSSGPQDVADGFSGLCVTFSLFYVLLRLLNPDKSAREISHHLRHGRAPAETRRTVMRLNRYAIDVLRSFRRGSLIRAGRRCDRPSPASDTRGSASPRAARSARRGRGVRTGPWRGSAPPTNR